MFLIESKQQVLGRTSRLLSFDTKLTLKKCLQQFCVAAGTCLRNRWLSTTGHKKTDPQKDSLTDWSSVVMWLWSLWYDTGSTENNAFNNFSIFANIRSRGKVLTGQFSNNDTRTDIQTDGSYLWSTHSRWAQVQLYTQKFKKCFFWHSKVHREDRKAHRKQVEGGGVYRDSHKQTQAESNAIS
jgi:hypothetical protein